MQMPTRGILTTAPFFTPFFEYEMMLLGYSNVCNKKYYTNQQFDFIEKILGPLYMTSHIKVEMLEIKTLPL